MDVSHLTDSGFWELADLTSRPFIASHSNARRICSHPRNLNDDQIRAIIAMDGRIGITYVPYFVSSEPRVAVADVLKHIDHICSLGGERHLMLGSDFDGISSYVDGLRHPGEMTALTAALRAAYSDEQASRFLNGNAISFLLCNLPESAFPNLSASVIDSI